ncbi:MAG: hypothetical protein IKT58_05790 [Oscillospiraceae bacterium]|nr:hypothetical protein [Oscillospiraceae bacterium]
MKSMTPFQKALLTSTEAQFADVPEEGQIQIVPSQKFYRNVSGKRMSRRPLRRAILVAAALALFVGSVSAVHYFTMGNVGIEIYQFPLSAEEIANGATAGSYVVKLKFPEDFSDTGAPNSIETFYVPTLEVFEKADYSHYEIANEDYRYFSTLSKEEIEELNREYENLLESGQNEIHFYTPFTDRIPQNPTFAHGEWYVAGNQITFSQRLAKNISEGVFYTIHYPGERHPEAYNELLTIGNYEVLAIAVEHDLPYEEEAYRHTTHHWFWSDGEYLFSIMAQDVDQTFMQEFMESVQPIEDIETYFGQE